MFANEEKQKRDMVQSAAELLIIMKRDGIYIK